jgi:hypothetical protein
MHRGLQTEPDDVSAKLLTELRLPRQSRVDQRAGGQRGVYQIGDVNARSCVIIGTFGVIFTLKYAAS